MKAFLARLTGPQKTVAMLVSIIVLMGALTWAAVPFYSWFCKVTGYGGTVSVAEKSSDVVLDRTITIRFDGTVDSSLPWTFKPVAREMTLHIGETGLAFFEATNISDQPIAGQAAYNVTPDIAGGYFDKIQCFCFTEQVLQPGETVQMPVSFFVDPSIVDDPDAKFVQEITLSYTFFRIDLPQDQSAALTSPSSDAIETN